MFLAFIILHVPYLLESAEKQARYSSIPPKLSVGMPPRELIREAKGNTLIHRDVLSTPAHGCFIIELCFWMFYDPDVHLSLIIDTVCHDASQSSRIL
jgi:hypothetical protein